MPLVATKVLNMVGDPRTTPEQLADVVMTDQALSAKLIRIANSAEYAFGRRCASTRDAIHLLGFLLVRRLAVTASLADLFDGSDANDTAFDLDLFWGHSLTVAVAAEAVAKSTRTVRADEAFTAGILHDIGRLAIRRALPEEFRASLDLAASEGISLREAEMRATGHSHEQVGAALALKWRFPPHLVAAIESHHNSELTVEDGLSGIIANCDRLVTRLGIVSDFGNRDLEGEIEPELREVATLAGGTTAIMNHAAILMDEFLDRPGFEFMAFTEV